MFSEKALFDTQVDVAKHGTSLLTSHLTETYRHGGEYLSRQWIITTMITLIGFVVYGLVVKQLIPVNVANPRVKAGLDDVLKMGTVLIVSQVVTSHMAGRVNFPDAWLNVTAVILAAFFLFHVVVAPQLPVVRGYQATIMDVAKFGLVSTAAHYYVGGRFNEDFLVSLGGILGGFVLFHEVLAPRLFI